jgi:hypothetical protein
MPRMAGSSVGWGVGDFAAGARALDARARRMLRMTVSSVGW